MVLSVLILKLLVVERNCILNSCKQSTYVVCSHHITIEVSRHRKFQPSKLCYRVIRSADPTIRQRSIIAQKIARSFFTLSNCNLTCFCRSEIGNRLHSSADYSKSAITYNFFPAHIFTVKLNLS